MTHTEARGYDERLIEWLRLRARGVSSGRIGYAYNVSAEQVRAHTNLVLNADLAESGEHRSRVLPAYRLVTQ